MRFAIVLGLMCLVVMPPVSYLLIVYIVFNASIDIANRIGYQEESNSIKIKFRHSNSPNNRPLS